MCRKPRATIWHATVTVTATNTIRPRQHVIRHIATVRLPIMFKQASGRQGHGAHRTGRPDTALRSPTQSTRRPRPLYKHPGAHRRLSVRDVATQGERVASTAIRVLHLKGGRPRRGKEGITRRALLRSGNHSANGPAGVRGTPMDCNGAVKEQRGLTSNAIQHALLRTHHRHVPIRESIK